MSERSELPVLVRDLMSVGVATCDPATPLVEVVRLLLVKEAEAVVVLDDQGAAIGVVGQDELVAAFGRGEYQEQTAEQIMREDIPEVPPDVLLPVAAQMMQDQKARVAFLLHRAAGIAYPAAALSYRHLLRLMALREGESLPDLGLAAEREAPLAAFFRRRDEARRKAAKGSLGQD
jgi:CBS-domain-containing membrane protein